MNLQSVPESDREPWSDRTVARFLNRLSASEILQLVADLEANFLETVRKHFVLTKPQYNSLTTTTPRVIDTIIESLRLLARTRASSPAVTIRLLGIARDHCSGMPAQFVDVSLPTEGDPLKVMILKGGEGGGGGGPRPSPSPSPERPSAPGYDPTRPSNDAQDKQLKDMGIGPGGGERPGGEGTGGGGSP